MKLLITLVFVFVYIQSCLSTHVLGGYIHASQISINSGAQTAEYQVKTVLYVSCITGVAQPPIDVNLGAYDLVTDQVVTNSILPQISIDSILIGDSCTSIPVCVQAVTYQATMTLPFNANGYYFQYQTFARHTTDNVVNTSGQGISLYAEIADPSISNSMPEFNGWLPNSFLCINHTDSFLLDAIDVDGDSLVYTLSTPLDCSSNAPSSTGTASKPYPLINWQFGFSLSSIVGGMPALSLDPNDGTVRFGNPINTGRYSCAVRVEEYRNGVKLGESNIEVVLYSASCAYADASALPNPLYLNQNDTVYFTNTSTINGTYCWDFGNGDTSMVFEPHTTYSTPGNYQVQLISKDGPCVDTTYLWVIVQNSNDITQINADKIKLFPNPVQDIINIQTQAKGIITIRGINGNLILSQSINNRNARLNISHLESGVYLLEFNDEKNSSFSNFIKY